MGYRRNRDQRDSRSEYSADKGVADLWRINRAQVALVDRPGDIRYILSISQLTAIFAFETINIGAGKIPFAFHVSHWLAALWTNRQWGHRHDKNNNQRGLNRIDAPQRYRMLTLVARRIESFS